MFLAIRCILVQVSLDHGHSVTWTRGCGREGAGLGVCVRGGGKGEWLGKRGVDDEGVLLGACL